MAIGISEDSTRPVKVLTYFMDARIEQSINDLQEEYLCDAKSTVLTHDIASFCAEIHEPYD